MEVSVYRRVQRAICGLTGVVDIDTLQLHRFQVLSFGRVETVTAIIPSTKTLMTEPEPSPVVDLGVF